MVNIYKPKLTNLQQGILRLMFINTGLSFNFHSIAKKLEVSQQAIKKAIKPLEEKKLITITKDPETKRHTITLKTDNPLVIGLKRAENLKILYETGLIDFLEEKHPSSTIILFGSYSRGDDTIKSDIDIAIINNKEKIIKLTEFEKKLQKKIIINYYQSINEIHKNLRENILNGIILSGGIELWD